MRRATAGRSWRRSACSRPTRIAVAVLQLCDGARSVEAIAAELAQTYNAPKERILRRHHAHAAGARRQGRGGGVSVQPHPRRHRTPRVRAPDRPAGRADPPLSAAVPLLLQPAGAGARRRRAADRNLARRAGAGGRARRAAAPSLRRRADRAAATWRQIVAQAAKVGLYSNLITAAVTARRASVWSGWRPPASTTCRSRSRTPTPDNADRIAHYRGGHAKKLEAAGWVRALGLPLTLNAPIHRQNIASLPAIIELAVSLGAQRLEVAHVQYYGWALQQPRRP